MDHAVAACFAFVLFALSVYAWRDLFKTERTVRPYIDDIRSGLMHLITTTWAGQVPRSDMARARRRERGDQDQRRRGMKHTWYVTFEVPTDGTLLRRRHPRLTKTFETEAAARDFARNKFNDGLIVTAGTINPHLPRASIPSVEIPAWLEQCGQVDPDQ